MELAPATSRLTQALIWHDEAVRLLVEGGDPQVAERLLHDALTVAEEADQFEGRYAAMHVLFVFDWLFGDLPAAVAWAERMVTIVEEARHRGWAPEAHRHLAQILVEQGNISAAETHALRAIETVAADDVYSVASSKLALGEVRDRQGRTDEAGKLLTEAVREAHSLGFQREAIDFDLSLALFQLANGRTAEGDEAMVRVRQDVVRFYTAASPLLGWIDRREAAARVRGGNATG
jgi:tetratricopeptide (TPR) repeat protein